MGPPSLMYFQYNQNQIRIVFIAKKKMKRKIHTYTGETGGKFTYYRTSGQKKCIEKSETSIRNGSYEARIY